MYPQAQQILVAIQDLSGTNLGRSRFEASSGHYQIPSEQFPCVLTDAHSQILVHAGDMAYRILRPEVEQGARKVQVDRKPT